MSQIWKWIWIDSRNAKKVPHKASQSTLPNASERSRRIIQNESFAAKVLCKNEVAVNKCPSTILPFVNPCCLEPIIFRFFPCEGTRVALGRKSDGNFVEKYKIVGWFWAYFEDCGLPWCWDLAGGKRRPKHLAIVQRQTQRKWLIHRIGNLKSATARNVSVNSGRAIGIIYPPAGVNIHLGEVVLHPSSTMQHHSCSISPPPQTYDLFRQCSVRLWNFWHFAVRASPLQ